MRNVHNWSDERARAFLVDYSLRKIRSDKKETTTKSRKSVICPISKCMAKIVRLPQHLQIVHKMNPNSIKYQQILMSKELEYSEDDDEA